MNKITKESPLISKDKDLLDEFDNYNKSIEYKPNLNFTDEYESDIVFNNNIENEIDENKETIIEDLLNDLKDVINLINKLPQPIKDMVNEITDQVIDSVDDDLYNKEYDRVPEEIEWNYNPQIPTIELPDNNDNDTNVEEPDSESIWDMDDFIPIQKEENNIIDIIDKEYIKNLTDLYKYYFTRLRKIISNFWTNLLLSTINKSSSEIKFIYNNILLSSSNLTDETKHLIDASIRAEILKNLKADYFNNIFNAEESIKHIKQFKATYVLRRRYYSSDKIENSNKISQLSNNYLLSSQKTYDIKYDIAYENLFRYLESSNNILDDLLQNYIQEIKAKQIIIERRGIK